MAALSRHSSRHRAGALVLRPPDVPARACAALAPPALLLVGAILAGPAGAEDIADYMVMDVCTGADGMVLVGVSPIDPGCTRRRKIPPGRGAAVPAARLAGQQGRVR